MNIIPIIPRLGEARRCPHCGHECPDEEGGVVGFVVGITACTWVVFTVIYWLVGQGIDKPTLLEILKAQGAFFSGLRIW